MHTHTYKHAQTTRAIQLIQRKEVTDNQTQKVQSYRSELCVSSVQSLNTTHKHSVYSVLAVRKLRLNTKLVISVETELKFTNLEIICVIIMLSTYVFYEVANFY